MSGGQYVVLIAGLDYSALQAIPNEDGSLQYSTSDGGRYVGAAGTWWRSTPQIDRICQALDGPKALEATAVAARQFLPRLAGALGGLTVDRPHVGRDDDGSVTLEWRAADRRLAFVFDPLEPPGWHFVVKTETRFAMAHGDIDALSAPRLRELLERMET